MRFLAPMAQEARIDGGVDHGGGVDAACLRWGGTRADWLDLSTGINPRPYPVPPITPDAWTALPDRAAFAGLEQAARAFWHVPEGAALLPAPGASALIARLPALAAPGRVAIPGPTYNEHACAFAAAGWTVTDRAEPGDDAGVVVHPNNPDGCFHPAPDAPLRIIDESFCDICPERSHILWSDQPGTVVLKSFGKFWGLAGLRLGFAIGAPDLIARLSGMIGPWAVSGPALAIGTTALSDPIWARQTRERLAQDAQRLDGLMTRAGATALGGTDLFRLYDVTDAAHWTERLAAHRILARSFPYSTRWLRLGLPDGAGWSRLEAAL